MDDDDQVHTLEFLLAFDGRVHWYAQGYFTKFVIRRVLPTKQRPHGLSYTLTLHAPEGERLMGFDNAHTVAARGRHAKRQAEADHWHRTGDDPGRPYGFTDAETLICRLLCQGRAHPKRTRGFPRCRAGRNNERQERAMTKHRIISHSALRDEMMAVARGEMPAPPDAGEQSFESVEALMRLLTPENRQLLAIIRDRKPRSIAELASFSGRAAPNLTRTLAKLVAVGFVRMEENAKRRVPTAVVQKLRVEIDPFSLNDRLEIA